MIRIFPLMIILFLSLSQDILSQEDLIEGVILESEVRDYNTSEVLASRPLSGFISVSDDKVYVGIKINDDDIEISEYTYASEITDIKTKSGYPAKIFTVKEIETNKLFDVYIEWGTSSFMMMFTDKKHAYYYSGILTK